MFASFERFLDLGTEQECEQYYQYDARSRSKLMEQQLGPRTSSLSHGSNAIRQYYDEDVLMTKEEDSSSVIVHSNIPNQIIAGALTDT